MNAIPASIQYLLMAWGLVTGVLSALVIYGNTLSTREDGQLYLNKEEQIMMGAEQLLLTGKMHRLAKVITVMAVLSGVLLAAGAAIWVWIGLFAS
jgi:hypothetical protein